MQNDTFISHLIFQKNYPVQYALSMSDLLTV